MNFFYFNSNLGRSTMRWKRRTYMSLIRWSPMWDPFGEAEEVLARLPSVRGMQHTFVPAVDIYEEKNNVIVETPLAGFSPEHVHVTVEKGVLTIQGERKKEHEVEEKNYYRKETRSGSFYRQVALPTAVKEDALHASFDEGILKVTCPKAAPTAAKKIDVKVTKKLEKT